jgi:hypothetical protein
MRVMKILYTNTLEPLILWDEDIIYKYTWTFNPMRWRSYIQIHLKLYLMRVMKILYTNTLEPLILWYLEKHIIMQSVTITTKVVSYIYQVINVGLLWTIFIEVKCHYEQYFSYIVVISFLDGYFHLQTLSHKFLSTPPIEEVSDVVIIVCKLDLQLPPRYLIYKYTWTFNPMRVMKILYTNTLEPLILWELWRSYIQIHLKLYLMRVMKILYTNTASSVFVYNIFIS